MNLDSTEVASSVFIKDFTFYLVRIITIRIHHILIRILCSHTGWNISTHLELLNN